MGARRSAAARRLGGALAALPSGPFARLRESYADAVRRGDSRKQQVLRPLVKVARYRPLPVDEFQLADYPDVKLAAADSLIARHAYWYGSDGWEGLETLWWRRCSARATKTLELGANIGYYTVHGALANPSSPYVAVEPHPESAAALRANLALNDITNVLVVEAAAVSPGSPERLELSVPEQDLYGTPAGAFIRDQGEGVDGLVTGRSVTVATVSIEDLVDGVDLLKLDIEGHEADVLEPVRDWLISARPTIFVEVRATSLPRLRHLIYELADSGYAVLAIGDTSLHVVTRDELDPDKPLARYGSRDYILVDGSKVADL